MSSTDPSRSAPRALAWSTICVATVACALGVGLFDLALALIADHGGAAPLATYFPPARASALGAALVYSAGAVGICALLARTRPRFATVLCTGLFAAIASMPLWLAFLHQFGMSFTTPSLARTSLAGVAVGAVCVLACANRSSHSIERALRVAAVIFVAISTAVVLYVASGAFERFTSTAVRAACVGAIALASIGSAVRAPNLLSARAPMLLALTAAAAVAGLAFAAVSEPPEHEAPPAASKPEARAVHRILLVVVDTLRADHLSCYDAHARPTPSTDSLAADAIVFDAARSCAPWTLPSMTSILTGVRPDVHQVLSVHALPSRKLPAIAQTLHDAGYHTAAIGTNTVLRPHARLDRGFDEYEFHPLARGNTPIGGDLLELAGIDTDPREGDARELTDSAIAWYERHANDDTFLWLHYYDPHFPYASPEVPPDPLVVRGNGGFSPRDVRSGMQVCSAEQRAAVRKAYGDEVLYFDQHFGRLLAFLRERGWYEDTLIVLTADHGEEFWEHDGVEHGQSLYDELVHVPLIVKLAGARQTARVEQPVSNVAIGSTLLELAGLAPASHGFDEPALLARASDAWSPQPPRACFSTGTMFYENRVALAFDRFKYIRLAVSGREELYDVAGDRGETTSLHASKTAEVELARKTLETMTQASREQREKLGIRELDESEIGEGVLRDLRKIGYVK